MFVISLGDIFLDDKHTDTAMTLCIWILGDSLQTRK